MATVEKVKRSATEAVPVVKQLAKDEQFRKALIDAYGTARQIYDELDGEKSAKRLAGRIASDPKLQKELTKHLKEIQKAAKKASRKSHKKRNALILGAIALGVLYNPKTGPQTRKWLKEKLGRSSDDTFSYEVEEPATDGAAEASPAE